jgi:Fur family zinc uptake transcriptional regulator
MQDKTARLLKAIRKRLEDRKERFTEPRERVMTALLESKVPQKAYDLVESLKGMKPMSIYRALDFLSAAGLAHRIESLNAYVPCAENHCAHKDSQYLICDGCGAVQELHDHDIDHFISKSLKKSGFHVEYKSMELHGKCAACA